MGAMKKHEMGESPAMRLKEYGSKIGGMKPVAKKKPAVKKPTVKSGMHMMNGMPMKNSAMKKSGKK